MANNRTSIVHAIRTTSAPTKTVVESGKTGADVDEERNKGGRPSSYTEAIADRIMVETAKGLPPEFACPLAGISRATFYNWKTRGEAGEDPFVGFLDRLQRAEAEAMASLYDEVRNAEGGKDAIPWTSRAWCLERRWPRTFGKTVQEVEHTGTVLTMTATLPDLPADATPEDRRRLLREMVGRAGE